MISELKRLSRVVIKVGTAVLAGESGRLDREMISWLAEGVERLRTDVTDVAIVSSGAIAAGMEKLGMSSRPCNLEELQAVASVGQGLLMHIYSEIMGSRGLSVGQVLITQSNLTHRQQYLNARHTLERLFEMGVVPVVNENDTVATEEITFGDNDTLAALLASLIRADLLVLLTDTEGLYTEDPRGRDKGKLISRVERITPDIERMAGEAGSRLASGGMSSKVQAAKIAVLGGVHVVIADGRSPEAFKNIIAGEPA